FSSRRRHTRFSRDWSSDVCSSDLSILTSDLIEKNVEHLLLKQNEKNLVLAVHPYLHAFFTKGLISRRMRWYFKYKRWVTVIVDKIGRASCRKERRCRW